MDQFSFGCIMVVVLGMAAYDLVEYLYVTYVKKDPVNRGDD